MTLMTTQAATAIKTSRKRAAHTIPTIMAVLLGGSDSAGQAGTKHRGASNAPHARHTPSHANFTTLPLSTLQMDTEDIKHMRIYVIMSQGK